MNTHALSKHMPYMSPMTSRIEASKEKGFKVNFEINADGRMVSGQTQKAYPPDEVSLVNHYRFEGMSDPGDNNILYEVETSDGQKGTLVTPYGPDCPAYVADFITQVPEIGKQRQGVSVCPHAPS